MGEPLRMLHKYHVKWKPKTGEDQHFIVQAHDQADARELLEEVSDEIDGESAEVTKYKDSELSRSGFVAQVLIEVDED